MSNGKRRILLVDDEPSIVKTVGKRLEVSGYEVVVVMDGETALAQAARVRPDLIVLDLMLPKLSGLKVCAALKQDPCYQHIPIIIFTGKDQDVDEKACRESGADAYLPKARGTEALLNEIQAQLAKRPAPRSSAAADPASPSA